uniref:KIB1-4 beta-propeller domain-containing protein n=1 Tax=Triticum urartu TaxID=4572 RepID=A0A8R7V002_TRIUA
MLRTLAVIKPGDPHWTVVDRGNLLLPAMSFAGRFYCATFEAVMVVETGGDQPPRLVIAANLKSRLHSSMITDTLHLVDNGGELILVDRQYTHRRTYRVYRVDMDSRKMVPIRGLGGRAVFMGTELALSVSPSVFPSIDADAIYLGFEKRMIGMRCKSLIHLVDKTADAEPRQLRGSIDGMPLYEPLGLDIYLSWCVASLRDTSMD